jgi:hypothetical protein
MQSASLAELPMNNQQVIMTQPFTVPLVNKLTNNRKTVLIEAKSPTHAMESAQELNPGWAAVCPVRRQEEWS